MNTKVLVAGGSAGSLDVLLRILPELGSGLGVPVIIVLHRSNVYDTVLLDLLSARTQMRVKEADEKERMKADVVYVAPADYHLLIESDFTFSLDASEKVNFSRPSIDVTFQSVAAVCGRNAAAMLMSGASADGVTGLAKVKEAGGMTIVQDPAFAGVPYMPQQAVNTVPVDLLLTDAHFASLTPELLRFFASR